MITAPALMDMNNRMAGDSWKSIGDIGLRMLEYTHILNKSYSL